MTNANKFITIIIIAILIFLFQYKTDEKQWVNKASYSQVAAAEKEVKTIKKAKSPVIEEDIPPIDLDDKILELEKSNHLTYLDIYKKYKLAIDCERIFISDDPRYDKRFHVDKLVNDIWFRSNKRQNKVTIAQLQSFMGFVDQCWGLYLLMPSISDLTLQAVKQSHNMTIDALRRLLQSTEAFTPMCQDSCREIGQVNCCLM